MISTGMSLFLLSLGMFLVLNFFFQYFTTQIAQAASQSVEQLGLSEEIYAVIETSAKQISPNLTLAIISVLALGMVVYFIFSDAVNIYLIIRPLQRIAEKANQITVDHSKLGDQIEPPSFQEMQRLTSAFNTLSLELENQMQALEYQVQKRTNELEKAKANIEHLANHDTLTNLPNRRLFNEHASQAIKLAHRNNSKLALLMVDINQFKKINDTYGHMVGDEVLKNIADRFQTRLRESDLVARWGGDEFAILAFHINEKSDVERIVARIIEAFESPVETDGLQFEIQMCMGAALYPAHGQDLNTLLRCADAALYQSKKSQGQKPLAFYQEGFAFRKGL